MEFTKESLLKIKSYISSQKKLDIQIYDIIIEILRKDPLFNNPIKYIKNENNIPAAINCNTGVLYFSDSVLPYSENFYKKYSIFPNYNDVDAFNYKLVFTLLHELAHLKQLDYLKYSRGILGKIYKKTLLSKNRDDNHYDNNPYDYVYEYNADIEAMRIINKIYQDNEFLFTLNYLEFMSLLTNYYYDDETNVFLAEKTFKLLEIDDSDVKKIYRKPISVLIRHGLPIDVQILDELSENPIIFRKKYDL